MEAKAKCHLRSDAGETIRTLPNYLSVRVLLKSSPSKANYPFIMCYSLIKILLESVKAVQVGWFMKEKYINKFSANS